jgi:1-acyl-sn-glycerol-3-phosphate acyltransferase
VKARTVLLFLVCVVLVSALVPVLVVCMIVGARDVIIRIGKWGVGLGQKILGLRIDLSGLQEFDHTGSYVFMSNHLSFLDGPMLVMLIPQPVRVILKKPIFRIPVVGTAMSFVGFVPVDRRGIKSGKISVEKAVLLMKEHGYSFLIFPEGTRSLDGELHKFRRGGFFLAFETGVPVVPVSIRGTFELMPKGSFFIRKGPIQVRFHPAIPVRGFDEKSMAGLMESVRTAILSGLAEAQS